MNNNKNSSTFLRSVLRGPLVAVLLSALAACGGGSTGNGPQAVDGLWTGTRTYPVNACFIFICTVDHHVTTSAIALGSPYGDVHLIPLSRSKQPKFVVAGNIFMTRNKLQGTLRGTCDPLGGPPIFGGVTTNGSVAKKKTMDVEIFYDECATDSVFNLRYSAAANQTASFEAIAGTWSSASVALAIEIDGNWTGSTSTGCRMAGQVTPASELSSVYQFDLEFENCGSTSGYNGLMAITSDHFGIDTLVVSGLSSTGTYTFVVNR